MQKPTIPADVQLYREYLQTITSADLTPDLRDLAEVIGLDTVRLILSTFGGETLHIPTPRSFRPAIRKFIRVQLQSAKDRSDDCRAMERQLAAALGLTTRVIRKYARSGKPTTGQPNGGQPPAGVPTGARSSNR